MSKPATSVLASKTINGLSYSLLKFNDGTLRHLVEINQGFKLCGIHHVDMNGLTPTDEVYDEKTEHIASLYEESVLSTKLDEYNRARQKFGLEIISGEH